MSSPSAAPVDDAGDRDGRRTRRYVLVFIVEAATLAALYWFGRHFS